MTTRGATFRSAGIGLAGLLTFIALAGPGLSPLSAAAGQQRLKPSATNQDWGQPTFHGLVVGKSTAADVIRTFGKPSWKGGVGELVLPSDKEGEIQYEYSAAPAVDGSLQIIFGKRSGVVTAILLYPKKMTHADIMAKFGSDFEESNAKLGPCPTARERKTVARYHEEYSTLLVYRKLGLCVLINQDDGSAFEIEYLIRCR
jgi:hypothetical protein